MKNLRNLILLSAITGCCSISAYAEDACSNVALNKPATASSSTAAEVPNRAFDGDLITNWCTPGFKGWVQVDLQNKFTVDSMQLYVNQVNTHNTVHEIRVSEDMLNWTLVKTLSGSTYNNQILRVKFDPALPNVRGVKITTTESTSWVAWYEVKVFAELPKPTIIQNGNVLTSSAAFNNQWYLNGNPIPDATSQSYTATASGVYHVAVSNGTGCASLSETVTITITGSAEIAEKNVRVYPNPAKDNIIIEGITNAKIELSNLQGQVIKHLNVSDTKTSMDISELTSGVYSMKIITSDGIIVKKVQKQ